MFMDRISDFICGKVFFTADEGFSELFLSTCKSMGVKVKSVKISSEVLNGFVHEKDMEKLNSAAEKSGMRVTVTKKTGMKVFSSNVKKRVGIPVGFAVAILIFSILSSMIWSVDITGCPAELEKTVEEILTECGIVRGRFIINSDTDMAERRIESADTMIYRAVVDNAGSRVFVNIVTNTVPEEIKKEDEFSNIIALCDGIITDADILAGSSDLKVGDDVKKGDLLVSGITELDDGNIIFSRSRAIIKALTVHKVRVCAAEQPNVMEIKKYRDLFSPYVFGLCFFDLSKSKKNESCESYFAESFDTVFPFGVVRKRCTEFGRKEIQLSERRTFLIAVHDLASVSFEKAGKLCVLGRTVTTDTGERLSIEAEYLCEEDIGREEMADFSELKMPPNSEKNSHS